MCRSVVRLAGIIPANTGRIKPAEGTDITTADHPREYGENDLPGTHPAVRTGSSPRIRGELSSCGVVLAGSGIIPANTGRMGGVGSPNEDGRDHPREYGENRVGLLRLLVVARIIPANTGRIQGQQGKLCDDRDHPREYGENRFKTCFACSTSGSSPRIRGECLLTLENPTSRTDFTSLSFSTSSSAHAGGFGPSSFHGSSSRGYWMPHQCESFHVGGFPLATMHSHNKTLLVFICWVCHNRAP